MTLVLTEASELGIAMAADSAVTFSNGRSLLGAQKLLPIRDLNAGVAAWGAGEVGKLATRETMATDRWLQLTIREKINKNMTLWEAAEIIAKELNTSYGEPLSIHSGMHIAGYDVDEKGNSFPVIYHIHNGHHHVDIDAENRKVVIKKHEPIREFRAHKDHPPRLMNKGETSLRRNGDFYIYAILSRNLFSVFKGLHDRIGFTFPYPDTLETRGEYLRIWINFMSQVYRHSNEYQTDIDIPAPIGAASIGGPVSVLTINSDGIHSFYAA